MCAQVELKDILQYNKIGIINNKNKGFRITLGM